LALLREAEDAGRVSEAGVANRVLGLTAYFHGDFVAAQTYGERALDGPETKPDANVGQGLSADSLVSPAYLAPTLWALGHIERARELINAATRRAAEIDVPALADALHWKVNLEILRDDPVATLSAAEALDVAARKNAMAQWLSIAELAGGWARGRINDPTGGAAQVRHALARFADLGCRTNMAFYGGLLAELEAETLGAASGLACIDEALRVAVQTENRSALNFLHRIRGKILLRRDPADLAAAPEAFGTAIAIASEQGARSLGLQAALALAELYQSTGRPTEAHAVLAPALEGFSPTPEMPEIAEAQALLSALAATDEVKPEAAHRQRLTQLHVSYGNALIAARGYGAPETTEAFARARESTAGDKGAPGRLAADYGLWVGSYTRGDLPSMRARAMTFLNDLEATPDSPEASVAHRAAGITCWFAGEYREARGHLERALALFQPGRDDDMAFRFGQDPGVVAMTLLAIASWPLGEVDRRFRSSMACRPGWRASPMSARSRSEECTRPCSS
jgi:tetratricopeptide (TPR) repeat protein